MRNRGTKDAQDVEVIGYFSAGIEPLTADGAAYRLGPGRVAFKPIASLPAGEDVKLTIRARATRPATTSSVPKSTACAPGRGW